MTTNMRITLSLFSCWFLILNCYADSDEGHLLSDTLDELSPLEREMLKNRPDGNGDPFLGETEVDLIKKYKKVNSKSFVTEEGSIIDPKITDREKVLSTGGVVPGEFENSSEYREVIDHKLIKSFSKKGTGNFSFLFYEDKFTYKNKRGNFNKVYRDGRGEYAAILRFTGHNYLVTSSLINFGIGMGMGVGYNGGVGKFKSTGADNSETRMFLWTVPIDLGVILESYFTRYIKIAVLGGPSAMGIWQHRTDLEDKNPKKDIKQVGYGYFYEGRLNLSLSEISPSLSYQLLNHFSITKSFITLALRGQEYEGFKNGDVYIRGHSFGLGLTFEYL